MRDHAQRRPPLPVRLRPAERDFHVELRRLVDAAGLSFRALEESTSAARSDSGESSFYSKSQWGRWLNGQSQPPRKAVRKLAQKLGEEDIDAEHLVDLWDRAFVPARYPQAPAATIATPSDIRRRDAAMSGRPDHQPEADLPARYRRHVAGYHGMPEPADSEYRRQVPVADLHVTPGQHPVGLADGPGAAAPRQLPAAVRHFAGREAELAALAGQLADTADTVVISAVGGTAGIGKTALAVYFAHQAADQFPDGQLYVNLRGFDPTGPPMMPTEAIRGFLEAFDVPGERIPVTLGAQAALYRSVLADRRILVVLDNARDAEQVRPLLPGSPGCMVVVTSRNQLTSLIAADGACPVDLDLLTAAEARQMLTRRLGANRVAAEAAAVNEIITSCARLPLALSIVAARAATHPQFPLASLASELRDARGSLDAFQAGEAAADPRAVFSWSYQQLSPQAAGLFRLLGLHPGPDSTPCAAASLAASSAGQARSWLAELARAHLVTERSPGRYAFHDLLRAYAIEQARAQDTEDEQKAAIHRALDHYLHTADAASFLLHRRTRSLALTPSPPGVLPEELPDFAAAWAWLGAEYPVLLAAIELAAATGQGTHAWQLAWTIMDFQERRGRWDDGAAIQRIALSAARRHADRSGQAHAHAGIGVACRWLGRCDESHTHLRQALDLFAELGDAVGQADAHTWLGRLLGYQHRFAEAISHHLQALALFRAAGDRAGQAWALNYAGWNYALLGDHHEALAHCGQALALSREIGDHRTEACTLDSLGYAHYHLANYEQSADYYQQSIVRHQEVRSRGHLASVLGHLGDTLAAAGDQPAARAAWQRALAILDQPGPVLPLGPGPGYPDADQIRAKLTWHARTNDLRAASPISTGASPTP